MEVKAYSSIRSVTEYEALQRSITDQVETSQTVLAAQFDPNVAEADRVDRAVKNVELAALLRFYLERSERYKMINRSVSSHARKLLESLDDGFKLSFERIGLIFELTGEGSDPEIIDGVEFHHIGRDEIDELLADLQTEPSRPGDATESRTNTVPELMRTRRPNAAYRAPTLEALEDESAEPGPPLQSTPEVLADAPQPIRDAPSGSPEESQDPPSEDDSNVTNQDATDIPPVMDGGEQTTAAAVRVATPPVLLGVTGSTPQWEILGEAAGGRKTGVDLNETHTISLFGVQGGGKSYTLGSIIEGATLPVPGVNDLPHPLATVVFHYSQTQDYAPEFISMKYPNDVEGQAALLRDRYGAEPSALEDVLLLAPQDQVDERRAEFPDLDVQPLLFASSELQASHWRFLLGAVGNQSMYIRQLMQVLKANRRNLTLETVRQGVENSAMADNLKTLARERLNLAADYIDDSALISGHVRPGRLIIVDLRDEFIEKDESLGLFVVLMQLFADSKIDDQHFNKLVVFDEAHKYIDSSDLVAELVVAVREMRHKGMSILVASQDPPSVPVSLIELSDLVVLHKMTSPAWLKHVQKANSALNGLRPENLAHLQPGEAYIWAGKSNDQGFTRNAVRVSLRPRVTRHGGVTRMASS